MRDENELPMIGARAEDIGCPNEYTGNVYDVYFEVREYENRALNVFEAYLGLDKKKEIVRLAHGYHVKVPLQAVPDLVKLLSEQHIAVYQVVRFARSKEVWR